MICRQTHNFAGTSHLHVFVHFFAIFNFKDFNDVKISYCMIYGERQQATTDFSFGF